jgi:hypothetical protein
MKVRGRRIEAGFDAERCPRGARLLELGAQFRLFDDLRRALLDVSKLFFYRSEVRHEESIIPMWFMKMWRGHCCPGRA